MADKKVESKLTKKKLDASKTGFDKNLGKLPFEKFEKWFNDRYEGDAKKVYSGLNKAK